MQVTITKTQKIYYLFRNISFTSMSMILGDIACQKIEDFKKPIDWKRTAIFGITGFFVSGPIGHGFNIMYERLFPGKTFKPVLYKTLTSNVLSVVGTSALFSSVCLLEGKGIQGCINKVKRDLFHTWYIGNFVWIPYNILQYFFIPLYMRQIVSSCLGTLWNIFLSKQANLVHNDSNTILNQTKNTNLIVNEKDKILSTSTTQTQTQTQIQTTNNNTINNSSYISLKES